MTYGLDKLGSTVRSHPSSSLGNLMDYSTMAAFILKYLVFYNNAFINSFVQHFLIPSNKTLAMRDFLLRWMTIKYVVITITRWTCPNMRPNVTIKNEHKITCAIIMGMAYNLNACKTNSQTECIYM